MEEINSSHTKFSCSQGASIPGGRCHPEFISGSYDSDSINNLGISVPYVICENFISLAINIYS